MRHVLTLLLQQADLACMQSEVYRCVQLFFCYVNYLRRCLSFPSFAYFNLLQLDGLFGLDELWRLAALAEDARVAAEACKLIVAVYTKLDQSVRSTSASAQHDANYQRTNHAFKPLIQRSVRSSLFLYLCVVCSALASSLECVRPLPRSLPE